MSKRRRSTRSRSKKAPAEQVKLGNGITREAISGAFDEGFTAAGKQFVWEWLGACKEEFAATLRLCESPIESRLLGALLMTPFRSNGGDYRSVDVTTCPKLSADFSAKGMVWIVPQATCGGVRVDFMIHAGDRQGGWYSVVVECDGHEYHRSPERMQIDRARDRQFLAGDCATLRFTGSEIFRDAPACADQIADFVSSQIDIRAMWKRQGEDRAIAKIKAASDVAE